MIEEIVAAAKPFWLRALPYVAVLLALIGFVGGAYMHGYATAADHWKVIVADMSKQAADADAKNADELADARERVLEYERHTVARMAVIDHQHQEDMRNAQIISERTIAGLRDGTIRLRDKFTACQRSGSSNMPAATTSTSIGDGVASIQLQQADADLLVRIAGSADQVADQLRACQAVVRADRGM